MVKMAVAARKAHEYGLPMRIRLERAKRGRPMDDDNLRSALKACRDGVADALGVDDGSPLVTWEYAQVKGKGGTLRIQIWRTDK